MSLFKQACIWTMFFFSIINNNMQFLTAVISRDQRYPLKTEIPASPLMLDGIFFQLEHKPLLNRVIYFIFLNYIYRCPWERHKIKVLI